MASRVRPPGAALVAAWCVLLAAVITGPLLLRRGFVLVGDMVFVPHQPWKDRWLGVDGSVPRSVPGDAVVSALTSVVPGDLLQKVILLGLLGAGGWGVARLVHRRGTWAQLAAASLFVWNPFVAERLAIGHWALLCGYAALPWVAAAAERVRDGAARGFAALALPSAVAAVTSPSGGALAGLVALAVVAVGGRARAVALTAAVVLACNLPWLLPGVLATASAPVGEAGVAGFAARPDSPTGTLGSLLALGGIWKTSVVPVERSVLPLALLGLGIVLAGLAGAVLAVRARDRTASGLVVAAGTGLLLAWLPATGPGQPGFAGLAGVLPGAGLLRDSQKWVAPLALLAAVGLAELVGRLRSRRRQVPGVTAVLAMLVLLPIAVLPGLAWGQLGRLQPVRYPAEWAQVAALMKREVGPQERVVVLPFEIYRRYPWNGARAVLDPAPRYFPGATVGNDALRLGGGVVVAGEDPVARRLSGPLHTGHGVVAALARERVSWVLLDKATPGAPDAPRVPGRVVHDGPGLRLVRSATAGPAPAAPVWRPVVLVVDGLLAVWFLGVFGPIAARQLRGIVALMERFARNRST